MPDSHTAGRASRGTATWRPTLGSVEWLQPVMLAGLAGASAPIIIHLIHRKRAPEHPFPAIELLLAARKRMPSRLQLRHLLVMILRVLFVLCFGAALALPWLRSSRTVGLSEAPTACVILLDDTLSMQYRPGAQSCFEMAQGEADRLLARLRPFDRVQVVTLSGRPVGPSRFTDDFEALRAAVRELGPGYGHAAAGPALRKAIAAFDAERLPARLLVVLSDLTRSSWSEADVALLAGAPVRVHLADLTGDVEPENRHFDSVRVQARAGAVTAEATVAATGRGMAGEFPCTLQLEGGASSAVTVRPGPDGSGAASLSAEAAGRRFTARVLLPDDRLPADNVYYACGRASQKLRVLLVDGDPRESMYLSESFYLDLALRAGRDKEEIETRTITHEGLPTADLGSRDCVILANVPAQAIRSCAGLEGFVQGGGGLWVVLGDRADATAWRGGPAGLLPVLPASVKRLNAAQGETARLALPGFDHPIFSAFGARWLPRFTDARFGAYWLVTPRPGARTVLEFSDGAPALVEGSLGRGRILVSASPFDRDWNNFCIQPVFVPFVHETVRYLARSGGRQEGGEVKVGEALRVDLPQGTDQAFVLPPGEPQRWQEARPEATAQSAELVYRDTLRPGIYRVGTQPDAETAVASFAVNVDPAASDLRRLDRAEVARRMSESESAGAKGGQGTAVVRLWPALLWLALGLLVCESFLARK